MVKLVRGVNLALVAFSLIANVIGGNGRGNAAEKAPLSLEQVFQSALGHSESLGIQQSRSAQADERVRQARGGLLPNVNFSAAYFRQDSPDTTSSSGAISSSQRPDQTTVKITASQPL